MEIHVYDTYVKAADGHTMHFDVITGEKDHPKAIEFGKEWLKEIGEGDAAMTQNECTFCHSQSCPEPVEQAIKEKGYFIQKMEVIGIFHSHPNSDAFPSNTDKKFMQSNPIAWIIYSGINKNFRAFILESDTIEIPIKEK